MDEEIKQAVDLIYDRTGIVVPVQIVQRGGREYFDYAESHGRYYSLGEYEITNEEPFMGRILYNDVFLDGEIVKAENLTPNEIIPLMAHGYVLPPHYTDEQIAEYKERRVQETKMDKVKVLIHEFGHSLHHSCYGFAGKRIPVIGSKMKWYCRKNAKENFAVAFTEYVLREIEEDSPRYKRMDAIVKAIREGQEEYEDEICI